LHKNLNESISQNAPQVRRLFVLWLPAALAKKKNEGIVHRTILVLLELERKLVTAFPAWIERKRK